MIAVSSSGTGFRALAAYLVRGRTGLEEGRIGWASPRNLPTADPELAATLMRATAAQNVRVEKPVYHLGLAFDPGDPVDRAAMERVADRVLGALGLSEHQALIVAHQDRAHPHVHVLVNRVHPETGRVWDRWQDMPAIQAVLRAEERALGLRVVPGHLHAAEVERGAELGAQSVAPRVPTRDGIGVSATGETPAPSLVERARAVLPAVREATSWAAVDQSLAAAGLRLERRGSGLVVTDGTGYVKASSVGPDLTRKRLDERLGARTADDAPLAESPARTRVDDVRPPTPAREVSPVVGMTSPADAGASETRTTSPTMTPQRTDHGRAHPPQVPPFAPVVEVAGADRLAALAREVAQLDAVRELVRAERDAAERVTAAKARIGALDSAVDRRDRTSAALDGAVARVYADPPRARAAIEVAVGVEGVDRVAHRLQARPETFGALAAVTRPRAFGLMQSRDESGARQSAPEVGAVLAAWVAAERGVAAVVGQGTGLGGGVPASGRVDVSAVRAVQTRAIDEAVTDERAAAGARRGMPAAEVLERGVREAMRRVTPAEVQQLQALLTRPQWALAMRVRAAVKDAVLGRDIEG